MKINIDAARFDLLMDVEEQNILELIENVLHDSVEDPDYSAVAAANRIKCYIRVMQDAQKNLNYSDVPGFLSCHGYSLQSQETFEALRKKESVYYRNIQF